MTRVSILSFSEQHNYTDLVYWYLFITCFDCLFQPSSGRNNGSQKKSTKVRSLSLQTVEIILLSKICAMWQVSDRYEVVTTVRMWSTMSPRCVFQGFTGTYWLQLQRRGADWSLRPIRSTVVSVTCDCSRRSCHRRRLKFLHGQPTWHPTAKVLLRHLQSDVLAADPHLRCLRQDGEQPPPSRIDITGKNLATSLT
jgi:hypothetical protein